MTKEEQRNIKIRKVVELINKALAIDQEDTTYNSYIALMKGRLTELYDQGKIPSQMDIQYLISLSLESTKADPRAGDDEVDELMKIVDFYHSVQMLPTKKISFHSTLLKAFAGEHDKARRKAAAVKDKRLYENINAILSSIETLGQQTLIAQSQESENTKKRKGRLSFKKAEE